MPEVTIRKAAITDLTTLLLFEQGVISAERPFDLTLKTGHIKYYDIEQMIGAPDIELLVVEEDNKLIGCGYARFETAKAYLQHNRHAYLGFMYVEPEYRGRGVNKLIIDALEKWSVDQGITEMRLDVYYDNSAAIKAYEKTGFSKHMIEMRKGLK